MTVSREDSGTTVAAGVGVLARRTRPLGDALIAKEGEPERPAADRRGAGVGDDDLGRKAGYCPDPDCCAVGGEALDRISVRHPDDFTDKVIWIAVRIADRARPPRPGPPARDR
jgi:hypothetical protein